MYQFPWPPGTILYLDLPENIRLALMPYVSDEGTLVPELAVHRTATEGPYIEFSGYKIRAIIETTTPTEYVVRFA